MKKAKADPGGAKICDTVSHSNSGDDNISKPSAQDARRTRTDNALRAALLALLEREPLDAITVRGICREAGIHYATFFRHHASKEALLDHVARDQIHQLIQLSLPVNDSDGDEQGFMALCRYVDEHRQLWSALLTGGAGAAMREELQKQSLALALERAPQHPWLPLELATTCNVSLIVETLAWWLKQPAQAFEPEAVAQMLHRLLDSSGLLEGSDGGNRRPI